MGAGAEWEGGDVGGGGSGGDADLEAISNAPESMPDFMTKIYLL